MSWLWLVACSPGRSGVQISAVEAAPLVRVVAFTTSGEAATVTATSDDGREVVATSGPGWAHATPLIGLAPGRRWALSIEVDGEVRDGGTFETDPLPLDFPELAATGGGGEPGVTLVPLTGSVASWLAAVDESGEVVWLYGDGTPFFEVQPLPDGHLLGQREADLVEIDWLGGVHDRWVAGAGSGDAVGVDVDGFHHDAHRTDSGSLVALTSGTTLVDDYPLSYADPSASGTAPIVADQVVEFASSGEVTARVALPDLLDPRRIGYDSLDVASTGAAEWGHANAVTEMDGSWLISLRNQDALIAVDRDDGELRWLLANPSNWRSDLDAMRLTPIGEDFRWPYHQHAPEVESDGRILVLDNGNWRASPFTGETVVPFPDWSSRVVEYAVDDQAMTVEQTWEWTPDPPLCAAAMGDVDRLPNGDVLAVFGYVENIAGVSAADAGRSDPFARIIEVDPTGTPLWQLDAWGDGGWSAYRAARVTMP